MATPAEQFAQDWLLIMENNDQDAYGELMSLAETSSSAYDVADSLRNEWEELCGQVQDIVTRQLSPLSGELVGQILNYWGIEPFMIIARDLRERVAENRLADANDTL